MPKDAAAVFEILVREHHPMLCAFVRSLVRDADAADDVVQEAFIVAWKRLGEYDRDRPFAPWLRGIAARLSLAHHRKHARRQRVCFTTDEATLVNLESLFDRFSHLQGDTWDERVEVLRDCLSRLPDDDQHVLRERYEGDLSCEEIASGAALSNEVVKKRLQRARARLAECIERKLVDSR